MRHALFVLNVKATITNVNSLGGCGRHPPSVVVIYLQCICNRLHHSSNSLMTKHVYEELFSLYEHGLPISLSNVMEI